MNRPGSTSRSRALASALAALAVAAWAALAPGPARAQSDPRMARAKEAFELGQQLYLDQQYQPAAAKFLEAYEAKPFAAFLYNAAVSYERGGNGGRAIEMLERYLRENLPEGDRKEGQGRLDALRRSAETGAPPPAAAEPARTKGIVIIESKPQGANVYIDDKKSGLAGVTPFSVSLEGKHDVILEAKGYVAEKTSINPSPDKLTYLFMALSEEHYLGWIEILGNVAGAAVFIDDRGAGAIGQTPYTGFLKPGRHTVWVEHEGYEGWSSELEVGPGKAHSVRARLDPISYGFVEVMGRTTRGAEVLFDERSAGCERYPCKVELPPGRYTLRVGKEDAKEYEKEIEVRGAHETEVRVHMNPSESRASAWVSLAMSALLTGGGAYFALRADQDRTGLEDDQADPTRLTSEDDPRIRRGQIFTLVADGLFVMGGITGLLGLYYLLSDEGEPSYGQVDLVPLVSPQGAGAGASVRLP